MWSINPHLPCCCMSHLLYHVCFHLEYLDALKNRWEDLYMVVIQQGPPLQSPPYKPRPLPDHCRFLLYTQGTFDLCVDLEWVFSDLLGRKRPGTFFPTVKRTFLPLAASRPIVSREMKLSLWKFNTETLSPERKVYTIADQCKYFR